MDVQRGGRQILIHGLVFMFVGLVWGLAVPHTPYPRLALGAHIQFVTSSLLFIAMAVLLLKFDHGIGRGSMWVLVLSPWLVWLMAFSEVANAWWGTSQMLPISAGQAGAPGGTPTQELIVGVAHVAAGLTLIVAWALIIIGFVRRPESANG